MKIKITVFSFLFAILFLLATQAAIIAASIDQIAPVTATRSEYLEIFGSGFGVNGQVLIGGISAPVASWTVNRVVAYVPENASLGSVGVQLITAGGNTNTVLLNVTARQTSGNVNWRLRMEGAYSRVRPARGPDGTIYSIDVDGRLYAIAPSGALNWIVRNAGNKGLDVGPDGTIYTGDENDIKAFQPDGVLKWTFVQNPRAMILIGISVGPDGNIYGVATEGIGVFSLTPGGSLRWTNPESYRRRIVDYSEIVFGPNGGNTQLYFYANDHLRAVGLNGDSIFSSTSAGAQPAVSSFDGTVHIKAAAFSPDSQLLWNFIFPDGFWEDSDPDIGSDGTHYTTHRFNALYAINPNGTEKWHVQRPNFMGIPNVDPTNSLIVLGNNETLDHAGFLEAISTATQTELWRVDLPAEETSVFNVWTGQYGFNQYVDTRAEFSADGKNVYIITAIATGGAVTDRCFLYSISTDGSSTPPPTATLRSTNILLSGKNRNGVFTITGKVTVADQNNIPVSKAAVSIMWEFPDGQTQTQMVTTNKNGIAKFTATEGHGTYTLTVVDVSKTSYTFDRAGSILTASITK